MVWTFSRDSPHRHIHNNTDISKCSGEGWCCRQRQDVMKTFHCRYHVFLFCLQWERSSTWQLAQVESSGGSPAVFSHGLIWTSRIITQDLARESSHSSYCVLTYSPFQIMSGDYLEFRACLKATLVCHFTSLPWKLCMQQWQLGYYRYSISQETKGSQKRGRGLLENILDSSIILSLNALKTILLPTSRYTCLCTMPIPPSRT